MCVCVCGSGIPYVMGDRDGNIQNPCPCGDFFLFAPLRKQAYKSYRRLKIVNFLVSSAEKQKSGFGKKMRGN